MTDRKYAVAYAGELIEGVSAQGVHERLTRLWSALSASQLDALLGTRSATLKLFADRETADRFVGFMRQAGMVCWLRLLRPGEESTPILADVGWSPDSPISAPSPAPKPASRASARRGAFSPRLAATAVAIVACGAATLWYSGSSGKSRRAARHAAAAESQAAPVSAAPTVAAETLADPAPAPAATPQSQTRTTLLVPEPILVSARVAPAPKPAPPAVAEAAKLEGAAVPATAQAAPTVVQAAPAPQTLAMAPATTPAPIAKPAEVVTQPSYDRDRVAQPRYPVQAYRNREQGEVLLNVLVGADGKTRKVTVDRTSGSTLLDRAAVDAVKSWQFKPGTRNGVAREAARQVAVGFELDE